MTYYSFRWLADRIGQYGWNLLQVSGGYRFYIGRGLPQILIEIEEWRVDGRPVMVVNERYVKVFDESIQNEFGETLFDGSEEVVERA